MKGVPCGSQAVIHVGGMPQSEKPGTACGIRCLKREARSLERGGPQVSGTPLLSATPGS